MSSGPHLLCQLPQLQRHALLWDVHELGILPWHYHSVPPAFDSSGRQDRHFVPQQQAVELARQHHSFSLAIGVEHGEEELIRCIIKRVASQEPLPPTAT